MAAWKPDLVIHVGDYLYRQNACPAGNTGCAGSPWGDDWAAWNADFFTPAAPLLAAAPWIVMRGNHETCDRSGPGWFRLLDPHPVTGSCPEYTDPYAVPLGDLQILALDSSEANDAAPVDQTAAYGQQFAALRQLAGSNAWLLTHKPLWGVLGKGSKDTKVDVRNVTLEAASGNVLPAGVQLILSGHIHLGEVLSFGPGSGRPPQFVAGNGGTSLETKVPGTVSGIDVAGASVTDGEIAAQWGYLTLEPVAGGAWSATEHGVSGAAQTTCTVQQQTAICSP